MSSFHIGHLLPVGNFGAIQRLRELATVADSEQVEALYLEERHRERLDPYVALADIAQRSATMVLGVIQPLDGTRAPSVLAKTLSGLNVCSAGRASMALGDLDDPNPLPPAWMAEALIVLRLMANNDETTYIGTHFVVERAWNTPRLVREHPPFVQIIPAISRAQWLHELAISAWLRDLPGEEHGQVLCEVSRSSPEELSALAAYVGAALGPTALLGAVAVADVEATIELLVQLQSLGFVGALCRWSDLPDDIQFRELIVRTRATLCS